MRDLLGCQVGRYGVAHFHYRVAVAGVGVERRAFVPQVRLGVVALDTFAKVEKNAQAGLRVRIALIGRLAVPIPRL